ncbi:MAG: histidine kinase [Bacteroidetes bacterium]|nr:histidine kinase [Bacteroidota bacterium]
MPHNFIRCLLIALSFTQIAYGQFDKLINYNVKDGLSSSEMYGVLQDSKGFIWSCGDMGVSRYNGYAFKNFSTEDGLPDNTVFFMYEDRKERIWFSSFSGKLSFYDNGKIYALPCNYTLEKTIKDMFITSIYVDKGDTAWIGVAKTMTNNQNFFMKINPGWKKSGFQKINIPHGKYFIDIDGKGKIFGGDNTKQLTITKYNKSLNKIISFPVGIDCELKVYMRFILTQLNDGSYLASFDKKIIRFNNTGIIIQKEENSVIINIKQCNDSSIIVTTYNGVSVYADKNLENRKVIRQLSNKVITGVCNDKENGLWLTSEGHGLYYIPYRNFLYYTSQNGVSESKITCIGAYGSKVLVGHLDGTASILFEDSVCSITINPKNDYDQAGRLTGICNYEGRTIIATMKNAGYFEKSKYKDIPVFENSGIKRFIKSGDGNIIALYYRAIGKYDPKAGFRPIHFLPIHMRVDNIFEDSNNLIWLCSANGIYTYNYKKLSPLNLSNELFSLRASDISESSDKSIWIATRGGGVIIKKGKKIDQITEQQGLSGNMCRSLFVDSNVVWVGTNKGLSRISIMGNDIFTIDNFYAKNGLLTNEVNAIIKHDGKLWLAHNNGVSVFDITNIKPNKYPPPVYIEQVFVNDSLRKKEELMNLSYDQNYLKINFIGLSYKDAGNVEYRYKVVGIDSNWIYSNYTTVSYHTIPPGSYSFIVAAKNNDGYWSSHPAIIYFKILQPWWKTWLFIVFAAIVAMAIIGLIFKYRLNAIKKRERLKAIHQAKLSIAELKALRSQMNPHFIFNAINSVQYFITNNDPMSSQKYLSKFARLIRYVVDNSKPSVIPLTKELEALYLYLDLELLRFENKFEYIVNVNKSIDVENVQIPSMLIQPYVENAIWHGLMHKDTTGKIKIEINITDNVLICIVEDNGIGRKKAQEILREKNNEFHKSVGMSITQERLDIINQQYNSNLTVTVIDLEDSVGNAIGTRVELNLPFY